MSGLVMSGRVKLVGGLWVDGWDQHREINAGLPFFLATIYSKYIKWIKKYKINSLCKRKEWKIEINQTKCTD